MSRCLDAGRIAGAVAMVALVVGACAEDSATGPVDEYSPSVVVQWDEAALEALRHASLGPPMAARALAVAHTAMYDAWAAYDVEALGTMRGAELRRPAGERTAANRDRAVSVAAYRALVDLFPTQQALFDAQMQALGFVNPATDTTAAAGVGNDAADAVIAFRHHDGANQLGDLAPGAYADYTGYQSVNTPSQLNDPNRWQPLLATNSQGVTAPQRFVAPHWGLVTPFALTSGAQFRPATVPNLYPSAGYTQQAEELIELSANLTDEHKTITEFWADGPGTALPPGHWAELAQWVARRDAHTIDEDAQLFFALTNAMLDASIAVWDCKRVFDYVRPVSAIRFLKAGQQIRAWAGPFRGTQTIPGDQWQAYQIGTQPTPAFPEFTSGHSAFSAASAEVLRSFTGSDAFGYSITVKAGTSPVEVGAVPATDLTLTFATFSDAADQAGMSRRWGGIHFKEGDLRSRALGRLVGAQAWTRAKSYFGAFSVSSTQHPQPGIRREDITRKAQ